jgi:hypothetical protein
VASSSDGITNFSRQNAGNAILASHPEVTGLFPYGTGQPSAFIHNGWYYLFYTDTFGRGSNPGNGAGQYLVTSQDPLFQTGVFAFTAAGYLRLEDLRGRLEPYERYLLRTQHSIIQGFSVDWAYNPATNHIVAGSHQVAGQIEIYAFDAVTLAQISHSSIPYTNSWIDGPGLQRDPQGNLLCPIVAVSDFGAEVWTGNLGMQTSTLCP